MTFADHFSGVADKYAAYRPEYPHAIFEWLASRVSQHELAWDCACGNGQTAHGLRNYFDRVIATDASAAQIAQATPDAKIEYRVALAEASGLADKSIDLITVAQAMHWLDADKFNAEVRRVSKSGGLLATWALGWMETEDAKLNAILMKFQTGTLKDYWAKEVARVGSKYQTVPFPFEEIKTPVFPMQVSWTLPQMAGCLRSYSATASYIKANGSDPVAMVEKELATAWGDSSLPRAIHWPNFFMRVGRVA